MQIQDLFVASPSAERRRPIPEDQFQFDVNRTERKIVGALNVLSGRETVRVQTGQTAVWTGTINLPDSSTGRTRTFRCQVRVEYAIERNEPAARAALLAMLQAKFDVEALLKRLITESVNRQFERFGGALVAAMQDGQRRQQVLNGIRDLLRSQNVPAQLIDILPIARGETGDVDFADLPGTLRIRVQPSLEAAVVGYKARLVWGKEPEHRLARLFYEGAYAGRTPGPPLADPLVADQIQPVEAWFRVLLAEALGRRTWAEIAARDRAILAALARDVSEKLGRGTGRVVETIEIVPAAGAAGPDRTITWQARYAISGVAGRELSIEHTISYTMTDRDRWEAQGKPDPERILRPATEETTRKFLVGKSYNDVIELYYGDETGQARLNHEISDAIRSEADRIGCRLVTASLLLSIPEKEFLQGRRLRFQPLPYSLAQANLAPVMKLSLDVAIGPTASDRSAFARAQVASTRFSDEVGEATLEAARACLRRVSALDYYASQFVNGPDQSVFDTEDALTQRLQTEIGAALTQRFGLRITRADLEPGADPLIERMKAFIRRSIEFDETISLKRGDTGSAITLHAFGTVFIVAVEPNHWASFYNVTQRIPAEVDHIAAIRSMLVETLRMLHAEIAQPRPGGVNAIDFKQRVVQRFSERMHVQFGLHALLSPLTIHIDRPGIGDTGSIVADALRRELETVVQQLQMLPPASDLDDVSDRRAAIMGRIRQIRSDLREEEALQEQVIAKNETFSNSDSVTIEQDRITGLLKDETGAPDQTP